MATAEAGEWLELIGSYPLTVRRSGSPHRLCRLRKVGEIIRDAGIRLE